VTGKVIAVANMKGGVEKTATVVALAEALASGGESVSVLVIDADAQANASICIAGDDILFELISNGKTIDAFELTERKFVLDAIIGHILRLMKSELARSAKKYDYILVDCAPGISALSEASIRLADLVIVPTIPDFLSTYGLSSFCKNLWNGRRAGRSSLTPPKNPPHVLITRKRSVREHERTTDKLRNEHRAAQPSFKVFDTVIPEAISIAEALSKTGKCPSFTAKWGTNVAPVLNQLVHETKEVLNGT
jgi:chromosome partitioning protein